MQDVTFHSVALNRDMPYRVVLPATRAGQKLPVVYLLHGGGGGFRDWTNDSDVAGFAEQGLILVMPEGNSSYYVNSATRPDDRYEDYIVKDLNLGRGKQIPSRRGKIEPRHHRQFHGRLRCHQPVPETSGPCLCLQAR